MESWSHWPDASFLAFAVLYALDGFLTWFALNQGLAHEGNPIWAGVSPEAQFVAKFGSLGLLASLGFLIAVFGSRHQRGMGDWTWRVASPAYGVVCSANLYTMGAGRAW